MNTRLWPSLWALNYSSFSLGSIESASVALCQIVPIASVWEVEKNKVFVVEKDR